MSKPQVSLLFEDFVRDTIHRAKFARRQQLTVDDLKEELAIRREECEIRKDSEWKPNELDQIEAELTALHLADETLLAEIV